MPDAAIRILLIEDDPDLLRLLTGLLRVFGFDTEGVRHGALALQHLSSGQLPMIIVLDWFLPVLSGDEFLRAKQANARIRNIPVIVLSGAKDIHRLLRDRIDVKLVLEKPIGIDDLVAAIQKIVASSS